MSALVVPNQGELKILDLFVAAASTDLRVRLFKNNITPDQATVIGDYTEADFAGYAAATPSFGAASTVSNKGKIVDGSARVFTRSSSGSVQVIYGYYVTWGSGGAATKILWSERFDSSYNVTNSGDHVDVTAAFTFNSEN